MYEQVSKNIYAGKFSMKIYKDKKFKMAFIKKVYNFSLWEKSIAICILKQSYVRITRVISHNLSNY